MGQGGGTAGARKVFGEHLGGTPAPRYIAGDRPTIPLAAKPHETNRQWKLNWFDAPRRFAAGWSSWETLFDYAAKHAKVAEIEARMAEPDFWNDSQRSQEMVQRLKGLKAIVGPIGEATAAAEDLGALIEMAEEEGALEAEVRSEIERIERQLDELELRALLSGPHDEADAILTINARDGGTDANDWAEMLLGMYQAWAAAHDFTVELLDHQSNEEAGINHATIAVRGPMAYGYLKGEEGMHRLVRISPFNSEGKRQTSFAAVDVSPELEDSIEIDIQDKDIREDTFRAAGAGGQHVNKTSSAIRLTHLPTGVVVQCQSERSQHQNRANAWKMLRAKMARLEEERREAEQQDRYSQKARTGFGSQIRSYFLHPDQRVKDTRTGHQIGNFHAMLDGSELQGFLDAFLQWKSKESAAVAE